MGTDNTIDRPVIFFDGVCNLCNDSVQFVLKRDKQNKFLFASLQSTYARNNLPKALTESEDLQSIVLKQGDSIKIKSDAALSIARGLRGGWPLIYAFSIVPKFIRDSIYNFIARNRYRWFGKMDACMIPSLDVKSRFLD